MWRRKSNGLAGAEYVRCTPRVRVRCSTNRCAAGWLGLLLSVGVLSLSRSAVAEDGVPRALLGNFSLQRPWVGSRPDGHAPIGVTGDHMHAQGEVMAGYRRRWTAMNGTRDGEDIVNELTVLDSYPVAPRSMLMAMDQFSLMWAPVDFVTLMGMAGIMHSRMESLSRNGQLFTTSATGFGDTRVTTLWRLLRWAHQQAHANVGLSFPTGAIRRRDRTPAAANGVLPYAMQPGSGSYELLPGLTYVGQSSDFSWGAQAIADFRLGKNERDWRRGHAQTTTAWFAYCFSDWMSASARVAYDYQADISGADAALNASMTPTADPSRQAAHRITTLMGANLYVPSGPLKDLRLAVEGGFVPWQWLDGPELQTATVFTLGVQYAFSYAAAPVMENWP
jgi:hypothetical protein